MQAFKNVAVRNFPGDAQNCGIWFTRRVVCFRDHSLDFWVLGHVRSVGFNRCVFIGLVFGGVGVVPLGMIAAGLHGHWDVFWQLVFGIVLTFGTRALAMWLAVKIDKDEEEKLGKMISVVPSY